MSISEEKKRIRQEIREKKKSIKPEDLRCMSQEIFRTIEKLEFFRKSKVIMLYWSLNDEVKSHDFIIKWYKEKIILLPVITSQIITAKQFTGSNSMQRADRLGIFEPTGEVFSQENRIDLIIVPGIAFDLKNNRLGRGKAYYDRFLATIKAYKIGVCFDFQLLNEIPVSPSDITMDMVITEKLKRFQ